MKWWLIIGFLGFLLWNNQRISLTRYKIKLRKFSKNFSGFRIVQISDLHNQIFGKNQRHVLKKVREGEPDVIVITGDLVDFRHTNIEIALDMVRQLKKIAPVYMVTGNHELWSPQWPELKKELEKEKILLDGKRVVLRKNKEKINLWGVADPGNQVEESSDFFGDDLRVMISKMNKNEVNVLLSHRPEKFKDYVDNSFDLVLTGHAHGGQMRLPILGGLVAPHQGILPDFDAGMFRQGGTGMIVSRGLGNSVIPLRVFNNPEIVSIVIFNP